MERPVCKDIFCSFTTVVTRKHRIPEGATSDSAANHWFTGSLRVLDGCHILFMVLVKAERSFTADSC